MIEFLENAVAFLCSLLILALVIVAAAFISVACERSNIENEWNNGICSECGGRYEFIQPIGHQRTTHYWYECSECGHGVEIYRQMKEVKEDEILIAVKNKINMFDINIKIIFFLTLAIQRSCFCPAERLPPSWVSIVS